MKNVQRQRMRDQRAVLGWLHTLRERETESQTHSV